AAAGARRRAARRGPRPAGAGAAQRRCGAAARACGERRGGGQRRGAPAGAQGAEHPQRFTRLIGAHSKQRQWQGALSVLRGMQIGAVAPNVITFNASLSGAAGSAPGQGCPRRLAPPGSPGGHFWASCGTTRSRPAHRE
ncbi:unnamed protein product, partial [Prorocentrum cordatum]